MTRVVLLLVSLAWATGLLSSNVAFCDSGSTISVNSIICNNNNTLDGGDDFITFNLNGEYSNGVTIHNLPSNTLVSEQERIVMEIGKFTSKMVIIEDGQYAVTIPSPSCQPINLSIQWSGNECQNSFLIVDSRVEIPSMGQWGIMVLFIAIFIIGYLEIRKTKSRPVFLRTSFQY